MKNLKVAIIGCGYWGPNLVRNFTNLENCTVSHVGIEYSSQTKLIVKIH